MHVNFGHNTQSPFPPHHRVCIRLNSSLSKSIRSIYSYKRLTKTTVFVSLNRFFPNIFIYLLMYMYRCVQHMYICVIQLIYLFMFLSLLLSSVPSLGISPIPSPFFSSSEKYKTTTTTTTQTSHKTL